MITVKGYNAVDYETFQGILYDAYKRSAKTYFQIANEIDVNSTQTPINAITANKQMVRDDILTKVMESIGVDGFIHSHKGEKYYYIKNSKNHV